ncbi:hypothetical protein E3V55_03640 [Candidatus Marinimicrobia bacterium MT.SAG.3]|nr:hypothetical protein E3V55_03640 [Candidatus Marinimicrobia bacterium MT.SAG.3]
MATGRSKQVTGQTGEYLVAAELCRRGLIATTFTGNVPDFDILATDIKNNTFQIQVKAIRGSAWQFDGRKFLDIELRNDIQTVKRKKGKKDGFNRDLICVFVVLKDYGEDEFFIFRWGFLQDYFFKHYRRGKRPKNPSSFHCAIWPKQLKKHKDNWALITGI